MGGGLSYISPAVKRIHYQVSLCKKTFNWGLAYCFRELVYASTQRKHGSWQAGMALSSSGEVSAYPGIRGVEGEISNGMGF